MLNRLALRICAVRALKGQTLARDNVLDSESMPIEDLAENQPTPVIVVHTDDMASHIGRAGLYATSGDNRVGNGYQKLSIEMVLTQRMTVLDETGQPIQQAVAPQTSAALEYVLDRMERRVRMALMNQGSPWADMFRRFVSEFGDVSTERGTDQRDGVRFAGRRLILHCALPWDPIPGVATPAGTLWGDFMALAATDPGLAPLMPGLLADIAGAAMSDEDLTATIYGYTAREKAALGLAPVPGTFAADGLVILDEAAP